MDELDLDTIERVDAILREVLQEVLQATREFPPFHTAHEGWAILREEVDELWDEVKKHQSTRDRAQLHKEAIQCAAMAVRFVLDVSGEK